MTTETWTPPLFLQTDYLRERGYAIETRWRWQPIHEPPDDGRPRTIIFRIPVEDAERFVVWARDFGDAERVTRGGLAEFHEYCVDEVRAGRMPKPW